MTPEDKSTCQDGNSTCMGRVCYWRTAKPRPHHTSVDDFSGPTATLSRKSSCHLFTVLQSIGKIPTHRCWRVPFVLVQVIYLERRSPRRKTSR